MQLRIYNDMEEDFEAELADAWENRPPVKRYKITSTHYLIDGREVTEAEWQQKYEELKAAQEVLA